MAKKASVSTMMAHYAQKIFGPYPKPGEKTEPLTDEKRKEIYKKFLKS